MFACLEIPHFQLQAQFRENPALALRPCALLNSTVDGSEKERGKAQLIELTPAAAARGVRLGSTATQAQARCPEITLLNRSPEAEQSTRMVLHQLATAHTPDFEATTEGICTLDLLANPHARRDPARLGTDMVAALAGENLRARAGFAVTPDLALLASKLARPVHIVEQDDAALRDFLDPLPLEVLAPPENLLEVLHLWGIRTIAGLLALPAEEVASRLGLEAKTLRERALGNGQRLLTLVREPESFRATHDFEHRIETSEPLLFALRRLLDVLCSRLAAAYRVAGTLSLTLKFDDGSAKVRHFRIPDPSAEIDLLIKILTSGIEAEIEQQSSPAPVVGIALEAMPARASRHQFKLFESSLRDPHRFAETLARLEALLGGNRVGSPTRNNTHQPDRFSIRRFEEVPQSPAAITASSISDAAPAGLPLRRFRPPLPVEVALVPDPQRSCPRPAALLAGAVRGSIADARGPWSQSGDWWQKDARWSRQEWDIQLADSGALYRLIRSDGKWLLDGVY